MNSTLEELVENINFNLQELSGTTVDSALSVCHKVRDMIKENEFYKSLEKNGLENLLVFDDSIEKMQYIYIRGSNEDDSLKEIIRINININYFNETDLDAGGILNNVGCQLIAMGKKIKELPLTQVVLTLQLSDVSAKRKVISDDIEKLEDELKMLKNSHAELLAKEEEIKEKLQNTQDNKDSLF